MRLASFRVKGRPSYGIVVDGGIVDLGLRLGPQYPDLRSLLAAGVEIARPFEDGAIDLPTSGLHWDPVIPKPDQILCVGLNYRGHAEEVGRPLGDWPTIFTRNARSQTGHEQSIIRPRSSEQLDFEGEVAVIVGAPARHVPESLALDYVAGYSAYNDASLRDWQRHTSQYTPGKNFPATGAFGPWMVTSEEVGDPSSLELTTRLNGVVVQHAHLTELIFSVPAIISYLSEFTQLNPGDVVITGTPSGVGSMRTPELWMKPGDTVEVDVDRIGVLRNTVSQEV